MRRTIINSSDLLLEQWGHQVKELFPHFHAYQQETLAFVVQSIIQSGKAVIQVGAEAARKNLSSETKTVSHERRLQRFIANDRIEVKACWDHFLENVLAFWQNKPVMLVLDMTPSTKEATIVYLGILVQSRILPIAWCVMPQQECWDEGQWEMVNRLFDQVSGYLTSADCTLLADRGLSCLHLIKICQRMKWHYVLRIKKEEVFRRKFRHGYRDWEQGKQVMQKEGSAWYGRVLLWKEHQFETQLSACWEAGYKEPWFLISDRKASPGRVKEYALRMRVEATFEDTTSRFFLMECSRFTNREHLTRWLFALFLSIWWIAHLGGSCIHHGQRDVLDRKDRRDKGLLRLGCLWLTEILKKANRDLCPKTLSRVKAQLANCLPFSHRNQRLCFSIYRT